MRQIREIVETRSILETCIRQWMEGTAERICSKFTGKTCLVLRSDEFENFECQGQRSRLPGTKTRCALTTPQRCERNGTPSLQITSRKQQTRRFDRCRGVCLPGCIPAKTPLCACVRWAWRATAGLCHAFLVSQIVLLLRSPYGIGQTIIFSSCGMFYLLSFFLA